MPRKYIKYILCISSILFGGCNPYGAASVDPRFFPYASTSSNSANCGDGTSICLFDTFNRADSGAGLGTPTTRNGIGNATWTNILGAWGVTSNAAVPSSMPAFESVSIIDIGYSNCSVELSISAAPMNIVGIVFRADAAGGDYWAFEADFGVSYPGAPTYALGKWSGGIRTHVASIVTPPIPTIGHTMRVELSGSNITLKINGTTQYSTSDATYATKTAYGLRAEADTGSAVDNFLVEDCSP